MNYREAYGMHLTNGILFNHESPRRGRTFVTRKITTSVARIVEGIDKTLYLGNLDAKRDWGHARDYIEGMWMMLQVDEPDDYVLATGETHSVREFVEKAFKYAGVTIKWKGPPGTVEEIGVEEGNEDRVLVKVDPAYFRPTEVDLLLGDPTKAKKKFWNPLVTALPRQTSAMTMLWTQRAGKRIVQEPLRLSTLSTSSTKPVEQEKGNRPSTSSLQRAILLNTVIEMDGLLNGQSLCKW